MCMWQRSQAAFVQCSIGWELGAGGYPRSQQHPGMAAGSSGCGARNAGKDQGSSSSLHPQRSPIFLGVTPAVSFPGLCHAPWLSSWFCPQLGVRVPGTCSDAEPGIGRDTHTHGWPWGEEGCDICSCKLFAMLRSGQLDSSGSCEQMAPAHSRPGSAIPHP